MSTALTIAQQELRDLVADNPDALMPLGLDLLDKEDLRIFPARIKIAHEDDPDIGVKAGEFYNAKTNVNYGKSVTFTLLHFARKTRAEYEEPYRKDAPLLCGSDDGKMPRESTERRPLTDPKPGPCKNCDSAQWENPDGTKRPKPFCAEQHNFMLNIDAGEDSWDTALLTLQKSRANAAVDLRRLCLGSMNKRFIFATVKFVKGDTGNYYVPIFTYGQRMTPEQQVDALVMARGAFEQYKAGEIFIGADEGDGGNGDTAPHSGPAGENPEDGGKIPWADVEPDLGEQAAPQSTAPAPPSIPPMPEAPPFDSPEF